MITTIVAQTIPTEVSETMTRDMAAHVQGPRVSFEIIRTPGIDYMGGEMFQRGIMVRTSMGIRSIKVMERRGMMGGDMMIHRATPTTAKDAIVCTLRIIFETMEGGTMIQEIVEGVGEVRRVADVIVNAARGMERVAGETTRMVGEMKGIVGTRG